MPAPASTWPRERRSRFGLDHPPGAAIGQQGRQHRVVQLVAATHRAVGAKQRQTSQGQIANRVQRLVAGAFVADSAGPSVLSRRVVVEHHRILKRGAARKTGAQSRATSFMKPKSGRAKSRGGSFRG